MKEPVTFQFLSFFVMFRPYICAVLNLILFNALGRKQAVLCLGYEEAKKNKAPCITSPGSRCPMGANQRSLWIPPGCLVLDGKIKGSVSNRVFVFSLQYSTIPLLF